MRCDTPQTHPRACTSLDLNVLTSQGSVLIRTGGPGFLANQDVLKTTIDVRSAQRPFALGGVADGEVGFVQ